MSDRSYRDKRDGRRESSDRDRRENSDRSRSDRDRSERDRSERDRSERDRSERDRSERDRSERDRSDRDRDSYIKKESSDRSDRDRDSKRDSDRDRRESSDKDRDSYIKKENSDRRESSERESERDPERVVKREKWSDRNRKSAIDKDSKKNNSERDSKRKREESEIKKADEAADTKKIKINEEDEKLLLAIAEKKKAERLARVQAWKQVEGVETTPITTNTTAASIVTVPKTVNKPVASKLKAISLFASSTEDSGTKKISKLDNSLQNVLDDDREKELNKDMVIDGADAAGEAEEDELDDETERERERFFKKEQQAYDDNELKVDLKKLEKEEQLKNMEVESESEEDPLQVYMRSISVDFKKDKEVSLEKARSEAAKRGEVQLEEELPDQETVVTKKKLLEAVDHKSQDYQPFRKDFYIPCPEVAKLTTQDVSALRKEFDGIKIRGKRCPHPVRTFAQCGMKPKINAILERLEYTKPTPIQSQALPAIMSGLDVIGVAKTGSGKTLAYLLPMFRHIMDQPPLDPSDGPIALIMVPTRELAVQIHNECNKFVKATNIRSACVYGGAGVKHQIGDLKRGAEVVVCTPGRMIDVLCANKGRVTNLKRVTYLVLDEADRMFDMGFEPQITRIIQNIRPGRQTVLFSATFPRSVEVAARRILIKPVEISIRGKGVVADTIQQQVRVITEENKVKVLLECIADWYDKGSILVFVDTQESTDILWREIIKSGYTSCGSLHGGKEQLDRDFTLKIFKSGEMKILVATSVAARGLDVPSIRCVVNFDCPNHLEDYVHRCGRTGRAGITGTAITFLTPSEEQYSRDLVKAITASGQDVPPELAKIYNDFESKRKAGVAQKHKSQFLNSKGYKFDDAEDKAKNEILKIQKMSYGVTQGDEYDINADSDDDVDDDDDDEIILPRDDGLSVTQALAQELMSTQGPGGANAGDRAKQFASEIVNKAASKLHSAMRYSEELEVNDYPQNARWKVLNQAGVTTITEMTGCGVTTKGVHVQPGRAPPPGQRKLFLFIEGNSLDEVRKAKFEVKRMLDEAVQTGRPDQQQTYGKYSV